MNNQKGVVLIISYMVIVVLLIFIGSFVARSISESVVANRERDSIKALHIAEAGIEQAIHDLTLDFIYSPGVPSFRDSRIYTSGGTSIDLTQGGGVSVPQDYDNFYEIPYGTGYCVPAVSTSIGGGIFRVELTNIPGEENEVWISSTGTYEGISKTIRTLVRAKDISPWDNVIFAGSGASGRVISGNVDIAGSVIILGDGLTENDIAVEMTGSGMVRNNYETLPDFFLRRIPPCPTVVYNGEVVESLDAEFRVKRGKVSLSGFSTVGEPNDFGDPYKDTVDGSYVTDGFTGNQGVSNVHSDNGTTHRYDLGDELSFPLLSDAYGGYNNYMDYARDRSLVVNDPVFNNVTPDSIFNFADANGSISMDGAGNMTIDGWVFLDGVDFNTKKTANKDLITYTGKGVLVVSGNISITTDFLTPDVPNSFPNNLIGFITPNTVTCSTAQTEVMGAFYAENEIISTKQTIVTGSFVSNFFDMGNEVPKIFQVPSLANALPDGFIGKGSIWIVTILSWQEL
ncbi:MAG: pilus assembly PilX N-terminal domain-containing protein [Candidatus Omnitrophota bacterium]